MSLFERALSFLNCTRCGKFFGYNEKVLSCDDRWNRNCFDHVAICGKCMYDHAELIHATERQRYMTEFVARHDIEEKVRDFINKMETKFFDGSIDRIRKQVASARSRPSSVSSGGFIRCRPGRSRTPDAQRASIFNYLAKSHHRPLIEAFRARRIHQKKHQSRVTKKSLPSDATNPKSSSPSGSQSSETSGSSSSSSPFSAGGQTSRPTRRSRSNVKRTGHASRSHFSSRSRSCSCPRSHSRSRSCPRSRSRSTRARSASGPSRSNKKRVTNRGRSTSGQRAGRVLKSARSGRGRSRSISTHLLAPVSSCYEAFPFPQR